MNRSGTKWLANILGGHSDVSAIQNDYHCGHIETNMLCVFVRKFDLRCIDDYIAAVELWSQTDFFRVADVDKDIILTAMPRPTCHADLLRLLFDQVTQRDETSHFVLKTGPTEAPRVLERWPDARVITIERSFHDTLTSTMQLTANKGTTPSLLESTYDYLSQKKSLDLVRRKSDLLDIDYADLHERTAEVVQKVCDYVGIDYTPSMLEIQYPRNTSFDRTEHPRVEWTKTHPRTVNALRAMMNLLPLSAMQTYSRVKAALTDPPPEPVIRGSFSIRQSELGTIDPIAPPGIWARSGSE